MQLECFLPTRNEFEGLGRDSIRRTKTEGAYDISPLVSSGDSDWGTGSDDDGSDDEAETEDYDDDDEDDLVDSVEIESSLDQSMDEAGDDDEESWVEAASIWDLPSRDSRGRTQIGAPAATAPLRGTVETAESEPGFNYPGRDPPVEAQHIEFQSLPTPPVSIHE